MTILYLNKYLESRKDENIYLFINRNKNRITKANVESDLKRIGKSAEVLDVHPHRCRRTFANNLARSGKDVKTIQQLMGHSNVDTTMGYITLDDDYIKNEYNKYI